MKRKGERDRATSGRTDKHHLARDGTKEPKQAGGGEVQAKDQAQHLQEERKLQQVTKLCIKSVIE